MLDIYFKKLMEPCYNFIAKGFIYLNFKANYITFLGFLLSLISFILILNNQLKIGLFFFILGRMFDGLDGAVARKQGITDFGGFLDIVLDFISFSLIILGFVLLNENNAIYGSILLMSFFGTSSSFLAFAIFFHKTQKNNIKGKSFYHLGGIVGGTETFIVITSMFLFPYYFFQISLFFSFVCILATIERIIFAYKSFNS